MNKQVGAVSWSAPEAPAPRDFKEDKKGLPFLDMKEYNKTYKMRVASDSPMMYHCHWVKTPDGRNQKVNCTLDKTCPVINEERKTRCGGTGSQARYYIKVIDRADGSIKVFDIGTQIFKQIVDLHLDEEWGHSKNYDISVKKGNKGDNPLYSVIPGVKKALTPQEEALIAASGDPSNEEAFIDLEDRCKPLTAEAVTKIISGQDSEPKARAGRTAGQSQPAPSKPVQSKPAPAKAEESSDDDDMIDWGEDA